MGGGWRYDGGAIPPATATAAREDRALGGGRKSQPRRRGEARLSVMVAGGLLLGPPHAPAARRATSLPAPTTGFRLVPNTPSCGGGSTSPPALVAGQVFLPRQQDDANRARADEYACSRRQVEPPCGPVKSTRSRSDTGPVRYDPSAAAAGGIDGGRTTRPRRRLHRPLRPVWWRTTLRRCGGQTGGDGTRLTAAEAGQARPTGLTRAWWRPGESNLGSAPGERAYIRGARDNVYFPFFPAKTP